jgi:integrase
MRLTVKAVEAMRPATDRREIPDDYMAGLYLVIQPSGARSWAVRYRHQGVSRKHTLGSYPAIDLKAARGLAGKALRAVAEGRDPGREKILARSAKADSVEQIVEEFLERHVRRSTRPRTAQEYERLLRQHVLPHWRSRMVHEITRRDVLNALDRVVDGGAPIVANRVLAVVRKFFNWCVARDIIVTSPCVGVKAPTVERSRDRVLSDEELRLVWKAADKVGYPFGPLVQMLALTGQRRDEVAKIKWDELDLEQRLWTLPRERVKADRSHEVPLSDAALGVLNAVPRHTDSPLVFTVNGASAVSGYSKAKYRLDALLPADMPSWRLHDLRRTCATGLAKLGVPVHVTEAVLNHRSGKISGIAAVYNRHDYKDEKVQALEAWGRHLDMLVTGKPAKVARLGKQRS